MKHNLAALDAFAKVMKVTNHAELLDIELPSYSLSASPKICLNDSLVFDE